MRWYRQLQNGLARVTRERLASADSAASASWRRTAAATTCFTQNMRRGQGAALHALFQFDASHTTDRSGINPRRQVQALQTTTAVALFVRPPSVVRSTVRCPSWGASTRPRTSAACPGTSLLIVRGLSQRPLAVGREFLLLHPKTLAFGSASPQDKSFRAESACFGTRGRGGLQPGGRAWSPSRRHPRSDRLGFRRATRSHPPSRRWRCRRGQY